VAVNTEVVQGRRTATAWDRSVIWRGVAAGCVGAALVAAFFLLLDLQSGHPFHTPAYLGSRLVLSESLPPDAAPPPLVFAFTLAHLGVFIGLGGIAAFVAADLELRRTARAVLLTALALFVATDVVFLGFALLFDRALIHELGWGRITLANLLAAFAMAPIALTAHVDPETRP
jgi:hypothetical protein